MKSTKDLIKIESIINRENDQLPFVYFHPQSGGKVTWHCGYDQDNKITTVFCYKGDGEKDRKIGYLKTKEEALYFRDELVKEGWEKMKAPQITTSVQKKEDEIKAIELKNEENFVRTPEIIQQETLPNNFVMVPVDYLEDQENVLVDPVITPKNRKDVRKIDKLTKGDSHRGPYQK